MLERQFADCAPEDECELPEQPETIEQDEAEKVSDRDYQAGFWSAPSV